LSGVRSIAFSSDGARLVLEPASSMASPTMAASSACAGGAPQLHLAELGDHLVAAELAVELARARQRLEVVGEDLPRSLVKAERALALRDHVLGDLPERGRQRI
jgi:hypothetical protein